MAIRTPPPKKNVDRKHFFQKYYVKHRFFSKKPRFLLILCTSKNRVFRGFLGGFWGFPKESRIEKCQKQGFSPYSEKYPIFQKIPNFLNFLIIGVSKKCAVWNSTYQADGDGSWVCLPRTSTVWKVQEYTTVYFLNASGFFRMVLSGGGWRFS